MDGCCNWPTTVFSPSSFTFQFFANEILSMSLSLWFSFLCNDKNDGSILIVYIYVYTDSKDVMECSSVDVFVFWILWIARRI